MSATVGISIHDYLSTHHEPECELISGELRPKPMGSPEHSRMYRKVTRSLEPHESRLKVEAVIEISIHHGEDVRIPDVAVFDGPLNEPPLLCIEIVSPSQHPSELFAKCETYHAWGIPFCWVIDPVKKVAWEYHSTVPLDLVTDTLRAGEIHVVISELFA